MTDLDEHIPLTDEELELARRGAAIVAAAMAHPEARAPHALRESLRRGSEAGRSTAPRLGLRRRWLVAPAVALACALVVLLVAADGPGDGVGSPSVQQVAAVARLPAREAAPVARDGARRRLAVAVQGLAFPDWGSAYGWRATGQRTDRVGNRTATTVSYRYADERVLRYAIVAGSPLRPPPGRDMIRGGARYRVITRAGRTTVTWTQAGHTCVIDAPVAVSATRLVTLAAAADA